MHILYVNWKCFGTEDAIAACKALGHEVTMIELSDKSHTALDWNFVEQLHAKIIEKKIDAVFSMNYFPTVSEACLMAECKYISWLYDSPYVKLYCLNIINPCNYIFIFDSATYQELAGKGINTVYYAPCAANTERLGSMKLTEQDRRRHTCDVSFVGSLYNEKHNFFDRLQEKADEYLIGYLEGLMNSQILIYGSNFLEQCLTEDIIKRIYNIMPYEIEEASFATLPYVYANYFLCRKITAMERMLTLTNLAETVPQEMGIHLYTKDTAAIIKNIHNKGPVDYYNEMPKIFKLSKINLNITLKSIKSGIPLRGMDILGAGGFLLTNYQEDFLHHFEPDVDFVYYGSQEEMIDKVLFYQKHDKEREAIARSGHEKVAKYHTFEKRIQEMLAVATGNH